MKKLLITAVALLLAAVFMSGCVAETDDPVVGIWMSTEPMQHPSGNLFDPVTYVFLEDGTGFYLAEFAGTPISGTLDYTWENLGDGKYLITTVDTKNTGVSDSFELELRDGMLKDRIAGLDFHRITLEEYAPGLWTGGRTDFNEYTDIQGLIYFGEDGKGRIFVYGPDVSNLDEVYESEFTWKAEGDKVVITGPLGMVIEFPVVNGELVFSGIYPMHKYTVEDNVYGLWESAEYFEKDGVSYEIVQVIRFDGTGVEIWTGPSSDTATFRYPFTWKMIDAVTYEAVYDDGEVWQFETRLLQLYDGETWYNKVGFDVLQDYALNKGA